MPNNTTPERFSQTMTAQDGVAIPSFPHGFCGLTLALYPAIHAYGASIGIAVAVIALMVLF